MWTGDPEKSQKVVKSVGALGFGIPENLVRVHNCNPMDFCFASSPNLKLTAGDGFLISPGERTAWAQ